MARSVPILRGSVSGWWPPWMAMRPRNCVCLEWVSWWLKALDDEGRPGLVEGEGFHQGD